MRDEDVAAAGHYRGLGVRITAEEEAALVAATKAGDRAAKDRLIRSVFGMIVTLCYRYSGRIDFDDLFQIGATAAIHALDLFDPDRGTRFSSYAHIWIRARMSKTLADLDRQLPTISMQQVADWDGNDITTLEDLLPPSELDLPPGWDDDPRFVPDLISEVLTDPLEREAFTLRRGLRGEDPIGPEEISKRIGYSRVTADALIKRASARMGHPTVLVRLADQ